MTDEHIIAYKICNYDVLEKKILYVEFYNWEDFNPAVGVTSINELYNIYFEMLVNLNEKVAIQYLQSEDNSIKRIANAVIKTPDIIVRELM